MRHTLRMSIIGVVVVLATACTATPNSDVLRELRGDLDRYPEYSVVLEDMRREGSLVKRYEHRYRIVWAEPGEGEELAFRDELLDWETVSESTWNRYDRCLGMTIAGKSAGESELGGDGVCRPAGYRYVGDSRYGEWRTDSSGNSFWAFYGKYALLSHMFGGLRGPVPRSEWDAYRRARRSGQPFYGSGNQWGTGGSVTRTTNPTFFERQRARQASSRSRFGRSVDQRAGRSRAGGARSRSGGRGGK